MVQTTTMDTALGQPKHRCMAGLAGNVGKTCTSHVLPRARTAVIGATWFHFYKIPVVGGHEHPPLFTFRAPDSSKNAVIHGRMPWNDAVPGRAVAIFFPHRGFVLRSSNAVTAIAEENVRLRHHSSPQQIVHLPLLWFGLHLSPCSP